MPATNPQPSSSTRPMLHALGQRIRAQRKALGVSAMAAAEAAGLSRVTVHRIEKGQPSVSIGAWANALAALGQEWQIRLPGDTLQTPDPAAKDPANWLERCMQAMAINTVPKALLWQKIRRVRQILPSGQRENAAPTGENWNLTPIYPLGVAPPHPLDSIGWFADRARRPNRVVLAGS